MVLGKGRLYAYSYTGNRNQCLCASRTSKNKASEYSHKQISLVYLVGLPAQYVLMVKTGASLGAANQISRLLWKVQKTGFTSGLREVYRTIFTLGQMVGHCFWLSLICILLWIFLALNVQQGEHKVTRLIVLIMGMLEESQEGLITFHLGFFLSRAQTHRNFQM